MTNPHGDHSRRAQSRLGQSDASQLREPEEYQESRIEGCKHIPLGELQARAGTELNQERTSSFIAQPASGVCRP